MSSTQNTKFVINREHDFCPDCGEEITANEPCYCERISRGDKIKTSYGKVEEVMAVYPSQIVTYESDAAGSWHHPSKVWKVG